MILVWKKKFKKKKIQVNRIKEKKKHKFFLKKDKN